MTHRVLYITIYGLIPQNKIRYVISEQRLSVASSDIQVGGKLILWKAKMFGVHTPMYILADLERKQGKRVTFRWIAD